MSTPERKHPLIQLAEDRAAALVEDYPNRSAQSRAYTGKREDLLLNMVRGLILQIQEIERANVTTFYELSAALLALHEVVSSMYTRGSNLTKLLLASGVVRSEAQAKLLLSRAEVAAEDAQQQERGSRGKPKFVGIVGGISSGKGTVGEILERIFGSRHYALSDNLRAVSLTIGGDETFPRPVLRQVNDVMKPAHGAEVFVRWMLEIAANQSEVYGNELASLDGFRSPQEAQFFKDQGGILIAVKTDPRIRYERLKKRNRLGDVKSFEEFLENDRIERDWIEPIYELCDFVIDNNGTEEELLAQIVAICEKIGLTALR